MAQVAPAWTKIPTKSPQLAPAGSPGPPERATAARRLALSWGVPPGAATRGEGRVVVQLERGVTVYPVREDRI
jgi:hypothetical protein